MGTQKWLTLKEQVMGALREPLMHSHCISSFVSYSPLFLYFSIPSSFFSDFSYMSFIVCTYIVESKFNYFSRSASHLMSSYSYYLSLMLQSALQTLRNKATASSYQTSTSPPSLFMTLTGQCRRQPSSWAMRCV